MVQEATYDQVVALVRLRTKVAVLLYVKDEPLCSRSLSTLGLIEGKLRGMGYQVLALEADERSSHYEETACVRVPQLRIFTRGRCRTKLTGILSYDELTSALASDLS